MILWFRRARAIVAGVALGAAGLVAGPGVAPAKATAPGFNGRIAFTRVINPNTNPVSQLFSVNPDGSDPTQLDATGGMPSYSGDGSQIAYLDGTGVGIINADGTNYHAVPGVEFHGFRLSWSPDGSKFLWVSSGLVRIAVVNADGSGTTLLHTDDTAQDWNAAWSGDGSKIVYWRTDAGIGPAVWVCDADGANAHVVVQLPGGSRMEYPSLSPDGTKVAFSWDPDGAGSHVFIANSDGSDLHAIGPAGSGSTFSPDGQWVAFFAAGSRGLSVMRVDGSDAHQITFGTDDGTMPDWQPLASAPPNLAPRAFGTAQNKLPLALFANADASFDGDGTIVSYEWRWGDNTPVTPHKYAWHRYASPGTYLVRLTVTDDDGARTTRKAWLHVT